tara:strand:+ start:467 stop:2017 length:1551 start_codon:yes stop_codon:yes gene_type:complete
MILTLQIITDTCIHLFDELPNTLTYGSFGAAALITAAVVAVGAGAKALVNSTGIKQQKKDEEEAADKLEDSVTALEDIEFTNSYEGMTGGSYKPTETQVADLGPAGQLGENLQTRTANTLGKAKGYSAQGYAGEGYTSEGYDASQTNVNSLARGANTGLTNTMNNLQVSTAAAEMQAQEADQSLAASQDLAAQAGTGAGGATALAAAAAKSKQGVASTIDQQVKANEQLRARGESELQRAQLAQGNTASQFDLGQSQFNVGAVNKSAQFGAQAANQAAQFGADAKNQSNRFTADAMNTQARFKAQAQNQFAQSRFSASNAMDQFNVGQQNQYNMQDVQSQNQYDLAKFGAQNNVNNINAGSQTAADRYESESGVYVDQLTRAGDADVQNKNYQQASDIVGIRGGMAAGEAAALADQRGAVRGAINSGITGVTKVLSKAVPPDASDRRLKKSIKLIGLSPSGLKIYSFEYKNNSYGKGLYQGVMSDEIPKEAVVKHKDGFDRVDYSLLDVEFKIIKQ